MYSAVLLLALMVPTTVALTIDPRTLASVSVWAKPLKFQFSIAVHLLTLVALMSLLPASQRESLVLRVMIYIILACSIFEIGYITLQAARGEASHFNSATPFARLMYGLMGIAAVAMMAVSALVGAMILRCGSGASALVLGAGLGLILGAVLGSATGIYMGGQSNHWVGAPPTDAGGLPIVGWSMTGGDLRVAHFVGLHMTQVLPLVGWLSCLLLPRTLAVPAVASTAVIGVVLTVLTLAQAVSGSPLVPA